MTAKADNGLTVRELAFVEFYVGQANGNAKQALRLTGHVARSDHALEEAASRILRKPEVTQAILVAAKAVSEQTRRATIADAVEQEEFLTRVLRGQETESRVDREGGVTEVAPLSERLKAAEQLAKRHGAYAPEKREVTGKDGAPLLGQAPKRTPDEQRAELRRLLAMVDETAEDVAKIRNGE